HSIGANLDQEVAQRWINAYQTQHPDALHAYLFGEDILTDLMSKDGAAGLWIMKGLTKLKEERLVLYPANEEGEIWGNQSIDGRTNTGSTTVDSGQMCPPHCPESGLGSRVSEKVSEIGSEIAQDQGVDWTARYQVLNPNQTKGFLFGDEVVTQLLHSEGAVGIWFYFGFDEDNKEKMILYAADRNGNLLNGGADPVTALY
ncbi:MAG: hypothetical protein AAF551_11065, partial [Bacteroidota bacterium]